MAWSLPLLRGKHTEETTRSFEIEAAVSVQATGVWGDPEGGCQPSHKTALVGYAGQEEENGRN